MALDKKILELVGVGASLAAGCDTWLEYHVKAAREAGATPAEICSAIKMAKKIRQVSLDKMEKKVEELNIPESW